MAFNLGVGVVHYQQLEEIKLKSNDFKLQYLKWLEGYSVAIDNDDDNTFELIELNEYLKKEWPDFYKKYGLLFT